MRLAPILTVLVILAIIVTVVASVRTGQAEAQEKGKSAPACTSVKKALVFYRARTWSYQDELDVSRSKTRYPERTVRSCEYLRFRMGVWLATSIIFGQEVKNLIDPISAIYHVFGNYGDEAVEVSDCESGHSIYAHNGQYLGLFQMGEYARLRYGHGNTALQQARAAHEYFLDSGSDWSPWSCKP